jgi:hypothetical protein
VNLHERVRADLDAGRAWKARDRLEGALANAPTDQSILETLAKICFELGDLPAAGKYWYLTDATGDDVERALAAFGERHPTPKAVFTALPMKAPPDAYPPHARARLEQLLADATAAWSWSRKLEAVGRPRGAATKAETVKDRLATAAALAVVAGLIAIFAVGCTTVVSWLAASG